MFIIGIFALALSALAAAACSEQDVSVIKSSSTHPEYFCDFYLSHKRTRTPFPALSVKQTMQACRCMGASRMKGSVKLPNYPVKPSTCNSVFENSIKSNFEDASAFCEFFLPWSSHYSLSPIKGLNVPDIAQACSCIVKGQHFCFSRNIKNLRHDTDARPFCESALASVSTRTVTHTPTLTTTVVHDVFVTQISTIFTPSVDLVVDYSTSVVPSGMSYPIYCSVDTSYLHPKKRDEPALAGLDIEDVVIPTPGCLSRQSPAYITSACRCLKALPTHTRHVRVTETASPKTISVTTTTTITYVVDVTSISGTVTETATSTVEPTGLATPYDEQSATGGNDNAIYALFKGLSPQYNSSNVLASCSCDGTENCVTTTPLAYNNTCSSVQDCNSACENLLYLQQQASRTSFPSNACAGTLYDSETGNCTFLNFSPLIDGSCAVPSNTTVIISGSFAQGH
ncbi:hypothetical protein K461DRAFT_312399 [Myriangium duriaei CBS 260.36]|uniref:Apple domain-containing protein n=1 Tax=Myriangium duriaei CBS 260.36 TaxID=1168546 RepID=A0A9P4MFW0_9PEZI|nr:hypothetical protein K461DRAFT_312399 [Myriangium duriaei CBS 260.36]